MQVFDGRHELIIAIKGKSVRKIQLNGIMIKMQVHNISIFI